MLKTKKCIFLVILFTCVTVFWQSPSVAQPLSGWKPLIKEMMESHPGLEAQKLLVDSLDKIPEASMAWDDPMVGIALMNLPTDSLRFDQEPMTQKIITFSQRIPGIQRRTAAKEVAETKVEIERAKLNVMTARLIAMLKEIVHQITYVDSALLILTKNEQVMDEFVQIANSKYSTGKDIQANVIKAQVERSKLIDKRLMLNELRELAIIKLNRILGRDPGTLYSHHNVSFGPEEVGKFENFWAMAEKISPEIKLSGEMVEMAKKRLQLEQGKLDMNMSLFASYGQRDNSPTTDRADFVSVKAMVSLPLWRTSKQDKLIAGARIGVEEARSNLKDVRLEVKSSLSRSFTSLLKEDETINLYRTGIVPQAREALASSMAAYQLDKLDFLTLLSNELTLLQYELELERAVLRSRNLSANIEFITGAAVAGEGKYE